MIKATITLFLSAFLISCFAQPNSTDNHTDTTLTEILLVGTLHFNQFHDAGTEARNFSGERRQEEFAEVVEQLSRFKPDAVFIERTPDLQPKIDSLFQLEVLTKNELSDGMSEVYQIGFRLCKENKLAAPQGIDYYESVSQDLFESGDNLDVFKHALTAFQNKGRTITRRFLSGEMTIGQFLFELNSKENVEMSHRLLFNTPAYVRNGNFKSGQEKASTNDAYIGAEYISLFYNRNLKIYSNLLLAQQNAHVQRIVLIIGQVHVGVLKELLGNNPYFKVVEANDYLNP
ncbi:MAG: hypothetical protein HRU12_06225 [Phaeodactylibacter sp.]|nr:hypothetical protein [Phaeodactylibacter sp.]